MRILAYRGAMSRWFTLIPEMAKPEKPTAMMRHVTAVAGGVVGILIMVHQVRLMMFLLKMVDYSMSFLLLSTLNFFDRQVGWTILDQSYFLNFYVGPILHA